MKTFHKGYTRQMNNSWLKRNTRYDDSTPQRVYFHHRRSTLYNLCFLYPSEKTLSPEEHHTSHTGTTHFRRLTLVTGTTLVMSPNLVRRAAKNRQKNRIDMCSCNVTLGDSFFVYRYMKSFPNHKLLYLLFSSRPREDCFEALWGMKTFGFANSFKVYFRTPF